MQLGICQELGRTHRLHYSNPAKGLAGTRSRTPRFDVTHGVAKKFKASDNGNPRPRKRRTWRWALSSRSLCIVLLKLGNWPAGPSGGKAEVGIRNPSEDTGQGRQSPVGLKTKSLGVVSVSRESVSRGAGCGKSARPDLWGAPDAVCMGGGAYPGGNERKLNDDIRR